MECPQLIRVQLLHWKFNIRLNGVLQLHPNDALTEIMNNFSNNYSGASIHNHQPTFACPLLDSLQTIGSKVSTIATKHFVINCRFGTRFNVCY